MNTTKGQGEKLFRNVLFAVLAARLLSMALLPITDTTEARYANISRVMADSGQWLIAQLEPGVAFWGKPPLFAWLTATSIQWLGDAEFAVRLPHFLAGLLTLGLFAWWTRDRLSRTACWLALMVLASTPLFWVTIGTVMTESALLLCTMLGMAGFWRGAVLGEKPWALALFAAAGLGMLAKGPVVPLMIALPIGLWCLLGRQWAALGRLPWLAGSGLALSLFVPWYIAAELRSPGFLDYFLVGEHFLRFVQPGWAGDLYGNPHTEPYGMIWLLWFQATGAWGVLAGWLLLRPGSARQAAVAPDPDWQRYLLCWMLAPMLFFTFSGNILWTYVISGLPALALLVAGELAPAEGSA